MRRIPANRTQSDTPEQRHVGEDADAPCSAATVTGSLWETVVSPLRHVLGCSENDSENEAEPWPIRRPLLGQVDSALDQGRVPAPSISRAESVVRV